MGAIQNTTRAAKPPPQPAARSHTPLSGAPGCTWDTRRTCGRPARACFREGNKDRCSLDCHQLRLRGALFERSLVPLQASGSGPQKDTQSQHLGLVVEGDHFALQPLAQAGEARDMAPDAKILPRSRSRHLLRQETGASA